MKGLSSDEVSKALESVPGWSVDNNMLTRTFRFASFVEAVGFVNTAAALAEELDHHPDIDIRYNVVYMALTSHDSAGLTELDFRLASRISDVAGS